jgi:hypothetical protein
MTSIPDIAVEYGQRVERTLRRLSARPTGKATGGGRTVYREAEERSGPVYRIRDRGGAYGAFPMHLDHAHLLP